MGLEASQQNSMLWGAGCSSPDPPLKGGKMKRLWSGFKDVWEVLVVNSFRGEKFVPINLFDIGVFLGIASMLGLVLGFILGVRALIQWVF